MPAWPRVGLAVVKVRPIEEASCPALSAGMVVNLHDDIRAWFECLADPVDGGGGMAPGAQPPIPAEGRNPGPPKQNTPALASPHR